MFWIRPTPLVQGPATIWRPILHQDTPGGCWLRGGSGAGGDILPCRGPPPHAAMPHTQSTTPSERRRGGRCTPARRRSGSGRYGRDHGLHTCPCNPVTPVPSGRCRFPKWEGHALVQDGRAAEVSARGHVSESGGGASRSQPPNSQTHGSSALHASRRLSLSLE